MAVRTRRRALPCPPRCARLTPYLARLTRTVPDRENKAWYRGAQPTRRVVEIHRAHRAACSADSPVPPRAGRRCCRRSSRSPRFGTPLVVIDYEHHRLPNRLVYPAAVAAIVLLALAAAIRDEWHDYLRAMGGGAAAYVVLFVLMLISPRSFGWGDVRIGAVLGLYLGYDSWLAVYFGIFAGFVLGTVVAIVLMVARKANRKTPIAFGPMLLVGALIVLAFSSPRPRAVRLGESRRVAMDHRRRVPRTRARRCRRRAAGRDRGDDRRPRPRPRPAPARLRPRCADVLRAGRGRAHRRRAARRLDGRPGRGAHRQHRMAEVDDGDVGRSGRCRRARRAGPQRTADPSPSWPCRSGRHAEVRRRRRPSRARTRQRARDRRPGGARRGGQGVPAAGARRRRAQPRRRHRHGDQPARRHPAAGPAGRRRRVRGALPRPADQRGDDRRDRRDEEGRRHARRRGRGRRLGAAARPGQPRAGRPAPRRAAGRGADGHPGDQGRRGRRRLRTRRGCAARRRTTRSCATTARSAG